MSGAAIQHLNLRVAWHDDRWNGRVCRAPSKNSFCIDLDRIRAEKNDAKEEAVHGKDFSELKEGEFPPCRADSGAFMNETTWWRTFNHPYQDIERARETHGRLIRTPIKVPPYSTFAVPFYWMLRENHEEIAIVPERGQVKAFSHVGEHATHDIALSSLVRCLEAVRKVRAHGVAPGPWEKREEWLNEQIHAVWQDRGAFPGAGPALETLGMRLGTSMVWELLASGEIRPNDDPWPVLDAILRGRRAPPQQAYKGDVDAVEATWNALSDERRSLLTLLSRFELSPLQARRWFVQKERNKATRGQVDDAAILSNPYSIVETDLGDARERPVALGMIDRGVMPDATVAAAHPVPAPSAVDSQLDWRRVRAAFVSVLRNASQQGDTLLTEEEALDGLEGLDLSQPCQVSSDWTLGNLKNIESEIARFELKRAQEIEAARQTGCPVPGAHRQGARPAGSEDGRALDDRGAVPVLARLL